MLCEAGGLDLAAERVDDIMRIAERNGFDAWQLIGSAEHALVQAYAALRPHLVPGSLRSCPPSASDQLARHHKILSGYVQVMDALEVKPFLGAYDAVLARLQMAMDEPAGARDRLDAALRRSDASAIRFLDAELLRLRAQTGGDRESDLRGAIELAGKQGAVVYQLRCATDYYEHTLEQDRAEMLRAALQRFPDDSTWPEYRRARAMLR